MPLFEVLPMTPAVQQLTRKLASLLPQLPVTQVTTEHEGMRLHQYQQTEECKELHRELLKEQVCIRKKDALAIILTPKANKIKAVVETCAGLTIPKQQPNEERLAPTLQRLDNGWVQVSPGHVATVTLIAPEDKVEIQVRLNIKKAHSATEQHSVVLFERAYFRTEPPGIDYAILVAPASPLGEKGE